MSSMSSNDYQKLLCKFTNNNCDLSQLSTDTSPNFDFWCYQILFEKQEKSKISENSKKSKILKIPHETKLPAESRLIFT